MASTRNQTIIEVTEAYIKNYKASGHEYDPALIESELILQVNAVIEVENTQIPKGQKWKYLENLTPSQISRIILSFHYLRRIAMAGLDNGTYDTNNCLLAVYCSEGENEGTYDHNESTINKIIRKLNDSIKPNEIKDVMKRLYDEAPVVARTCDPDLIPVKNGIFQHSTKTLLPFTPDCVFTTKSYVEYNHAATNIVIHNPDDNTDWDVETWFQSLSDDSEVIDLLWKVIGAVLRPFVSWDKAVWFISEKGSNGKSPLCSLMKNLVGASSCARLSLSDFGSKKRFNLGSLIRAMAIICDENPVGQYIDESDILKAVITHDTITIERKFCDPISYVFSGVMVQCLNGKPRFKDVSESFYRRQLVVPFTKRFTGQERKYIKTDYLHRKEVLEYVLFKVLNMDYNELPEPAVCKVTLSKYKEFNDPVREFVAEMLPECKWDYLPSKFLWALFSAWFKRVQPSGSSLGRNKFLEQLRQILDDSSEWEIHENDRGLYVDKYITEPEPLVIEYGLTDFYNPAYTGNDMNKKAFPAFGKRERGILRIRTTSITAD